MKLARLTFALAIASAATACAAERTVSPQPTGRQLAGAASPGMTQVPLPMAQVPLLFVVDGVRLKRDQVPSLTADQVSHVRVIKGHAALRQYGADASYGVVLITTKVAAAPHS